MLASGQAITYWLLHSAAGGGLVLGLTLVLLRRVPQPAWRQRLGETGLLAALLAALLCWLPAWLALPWPLTAAEPVASITSAPQGASRMVEPWQPPSPLQESGFLGSGPEPAPETPPAQVPAAAEVGPSTAAETFTLPAAPTATPVEWHLGPILWALPGFLYLLVLAILLLRIPLALVSLRRLQRHSQPAPLAVHQLLNGLQPRTRVRLHISERVLVPLSFGLWQPSILLPARMSRLLTEEQLRWVLAHELTHLRRRDAWSSLLCLFAQACFFYVPWLWPVCRHIRLCQEYMADAAAVTDVEQGPDYAEFLLQLTRGLAAPLLATGVSGPASDLYRRISMLLQRSASKQCCEPRCGYVTATFGLIAAAVLISGLEWPVQAQSRTENPDLDNPARVQQPAAEPQEPTVQPFAPGQNPDDPIQPVENPKKKPGTQPKHTGAKPKTTTGQPKPIAQPGTGGQPKNSGGQGQGTDPVQALQKALQQLEGDPSPAEIEQARQQVQKALSNLRNRPQTSGQPQNSGTGRLFPNAPGTFPQPPQPFNNEFPFPMFPRIRLGVLVNPIDPTLRAHLDLPQNSGLLIVQVMQNSAASKAGLQRNDILVELGGKQVPSDILAFQRMIQELPSKEAVRAVVLRKGERQTVDGIDLPEASQQPQTFPPVMPPFGFPPNFQPATPGTPNAPGTNPANPPRNSTNRKVSLSI